MLRPIKLFLFLTIHVKRNIHLLCSPEEQYLLALREKTMPVSDVNYNININSPIFELDDVVELERFLLNDFDAQLLEIKPQTEEELLRYYAQNTDVLYQYLRAIVDKQIFLISNEIRAVLGHIADYRIKINCTKNDLEKAYGHFRRMNLDAFKILCDMFEAALSRRLRKDYKHDFRNVTPNYLKEYSRQYFKARDLYLNAQKQERAGSDSEIHNIIELYYSAAKEYIILKQYYLENKDKIARSKFKKRIAHFICVGIPFALNLFYAVQSLVETMFK